MNAKRSDARVRKDAILAITVDQYIKTVTPVSSAYIVKHYFPGLSSATVRNTLAELEHDGYLTHPHTSAGRIPTELGYRYYVDHLMQEIQLLEEEKQRIKEEYKRASKELERLIERTSEVISDITNYTSIISIDGRNEQIFCKGTSFVVQYPDTQDLTRIQNILHELERKERLLEIINQDLRKKVSVFIGQELPCENIQDCSIVISEYRTGTGLSGRMAVLGPKRMEYDRVISALNYFSNILEEIV